MESKPPTILVVDDEKGMCELLKDTLVKEGYNIHFSEDPRKAIEIVKEIQIDIAMLDLVMPEMDGIDVLKEIKECQPDITVIIMTAYGTIDTAVEAMKLGAYDYITKPFKMSKIKAIIERILDHDKVTHENIYLRRELTRKRKFDNIIGKSEKMQEVYRMIESVASSDCNVLIQGESGTGKEVIARAIHNNSPRKDKPFIAQSCAAIPETLLESELFGHVKGAFTGASSSKHALLEVAKGGTFFFDEIGEINPAIQAKLLRVLEEHEFKKVGGTETIKVDLRIIAATNRDLEKAIKEGIFRDDLFYRLNVVTIFLPPLRERKDDIPLLASHFLDKHAVLYKKDIKRISPDVMKVFMTYDWPGNVRELENIIERAVVLERNNTVSVQDLPQQLQLQQLKEMNSGGKSLMASIEKAEAGKILQVLEQTEWRKAEAAQILGISRKTLWEKIKKYDIKKD